MAVVTFDFFDKFLNLFYNSLLLQHTISAGFLIFVEIPIAILVSFLSTFLYRRFRNYLNGFYHKARLIPGPPGHTLLGSIPDIQQTKGGIYNWLVDVRRKYGPVFKFYLFDSLHVMLGDPKDVELILKSQKTLKKSHFYNHLHPVMGNGLVTSSGDQWREHRKIITPAFHFSTLESFVDIYNENSKILIKRLLAAEKTTGTFDIQSFITLYALDIICATAMGTQINAQKSEGSNEYVQAVNYVRYMVMQRIYSISHRYRWISKFTAEGKKYEYSVKVLQSTTEEIIKLRRHEISNAKTLPNDISGGKRRMAFLDLLLQTTHSDGSPLTDSEIRDEVNTFMTAGHETTSIAICTYIYLLSLNPDIQEKVRKELKDLFGTSNRLPTYEDLQRMSYLDRTIKEAQRIMPSIAEFQRYIDEDFQISNYIIPGGSTIGVLVYAMHMDPDLFPNPERFDPDRFLPENSKGRHPFAYIPFSGGYRNCIGQKLALSEMKAVISTILRNFELYPAIDDDTGKIFVPQFEERVTIFSTNGIRVKFVRKHL